MLVSMLMLILVGCFGAAILTLVAWADTMRICRADDSVAVRIVLAIGIICKLMFVYVILGNYVISPMVAIAIEYNYMSYEETAEYASWWINMHIIDECLER